MLRKLTKDDVTITVTAEQDDTPVRGNALASGDDAEDRAQEDAIIARLDSGDVWAWAFVRVTVTWEGFEGTDCLGTCCYEDEADFRKPGGYFDDMVSNALEMLNDVVAAAHSVLAPLAWPRFNVYVLDSPEAPRGVERVGKVQCAHGLTGSDLEEVLAKVGVFAPRGWDTTRWTRTGATIRDSKGNPTVRLRKLVDT